MYSNHIFTQVTNNWAAIIRFLTPQPATIDLQYLKMPYQAFMSF